jgi:outer membrane protein TolC
MMPVAIALLLSAAVPPMPIGGGEGLPPEAAVARALDGHPLVAAAEARVGEARADAQALSAGPHEVVVQGIVQRRDVRGTGMVPEYDLQFTRPIRLPGKAALDRRAGQSGVRAAENRAEDARHQAALLLSRQWWAWLGAAAEARTLTDVAAIMADAVAATRMRLALRDASALELDQALAAEAAARAGAAQAAARATAARAALAASFPDLPLPASAPSLPEPVMPAEGSEVLAALVVARSHEIGATAADLDRAEALKARAVRDRIADPSIGVRAFSEQGGNEKGIGLIFSVPLGGRSRAAAVDKARAASVAAAADLAAMRASIGAMAAEEAALATGYLDAWQDARRAVEASNAAAERQRTGYRLGGVDLADRLLTERLARDAALEEVRARTAALETITRLRIDAHTLWLSADSHPP